MSNQVSINESVIKNKIIPLLVQQGVWDTDRNEIADQHNGAERSTTVSDGNAVFIGGNGNDWLYGAAGTDIIDFSRRSRRSGGLAARAFRRPRSHAALTQLMQVSAAHLYLTYPFVLSWSMLEAMSIGCLVIGSDTAPVREVIEHGRNGLLTNFFDVERLARTAAEALAQRSEYSGLRQTARETIMGRYDLRRICLPAQNRLVDERAGM